MHGVTDDILSVGVKLTAGNQTASSRQRQRTVWTDFERRLGVQWKFELWMVDELSAARLVQQSDGARQIYRRRTQRNFHPETLCDTRTLAISTLYNK